MRFDLDEQQIAFQQSVADYLSAKCPVRRALEPHDSGEADYRLWRGLMDLGLGSMIVPEEFGGLGLGLLDLAVAMEPIGRYAAPGPFLDHALATLAIVLGGSDAQKDRWLPPLANGEVRATVALAEDKGEWAAGSWSLDGAGRLSGIKRYVLHPVEADLFVVGLAGGRLGLVDGRARGIGIISTPSTDAGRVLGDVTFADTPVELMPRSAGAGLVDAGLVLLAADAFGGASRCANLAVDYAKEREQFGRPIGSFQAVKHQLAEMALAVEPSIGLYWYAAHAFDTKLPTASEAAAVAKAHITELYPLIARQMIEVHGGIGYTWEYGAHVWLKRALFDQAYLGSPRLHRQRVADMAGW